MKEKIFYEPGNPTSYQERASSMLGLLSIVLQEFERKELHGNPRSDSRQAITIKIDDDPLDSTGLNANIFFDLARLDQQTSLDDNIRAIIFKFITESLKNERICSKPQGEAGKEATHGNFVRNMSDQLKQLVGVIPQLEKATKNAHDPSQVQLAIACCELIYYYTYNSCNDNDPLVKSTCSDVCKTLKEHNRESNLFKAFEIPKDELRVIITKILNSIEIQEYTESDHNKLWSMIRDQKNVGAGTNEEVIGTIFLIMTKIKQKTVKNPSKFIMENTSMFVSGSLEMLKKNNSRDLREDLKEQSEKNILNVCIITFLRSLVGRSHTEKLETTVNLDNILTILKDESNLNPLDSLTVNAEKTVGCKSIKGRVD